MKKFRIGLAAALVCAGAVILPAKGGAAIGPIPLPDDPRHQLGEPDVPSYGLLPLRFWSLDFGVRLIVRSQVVRPIQPVRVPMEVGEE